MNQPNAYGKGSNKSKLETPMKSLPCNPPDPFSGSPGTYNRHNVPVVDKEGNYGVMSVKFFEQTEGLEGHPAGLASPMGTAAGTAIPGIGKGFTGKN